MMATGKAVVRASGERDGSDNRGGSEDSGGSGTRDVAAVRARRIIGAVRMNSFLDALALTCNVRAAADHAGIAVTSLYHARHEDAAFAAAWRAALSTGYDRLEGMLLEHVGAGLPLSSDPDRAVAAGAVPPVFDFDKALKTLAAYRSVRDGGALARRPRRSGANATREETNAALIRALDAAARRQAKRTATARAARAARGVAGVDTGEEQ